jgi:MoaA/NifB/PqqE/SkfB family radical SAM enzyme
MALKKYLNQKLFGLFKDRVSGYPQFRIAITYRCNNNCRYCSSAIIDKEVGGDIRLEDFEKILFWLKKQNIRKILLTGGEPFIHKDIGEILELCNRLKFNTHILTNGLLINTELKKYIKDKNFFLVLNINLDESYYAVKQNLPGIQEKIVMLRYNLRKKPENHTLLFEMAKKCSVPIRFGFTVPSIFSNNECYSFEDMVEEKDKIFNFVSEAGLNRVKAHFARPLPRCIFTESEWLYLKKVAAVKSRCLIGGSGNYASRAIVNPDLSVYVCYSSLLKAQSIFDFKDINSLGNYFKDKIEDIRKKPLLDKCNNCKYFKDFSCQGGCLIYKHVSK